MTTTESPEKPLYAQIATAVQKDIEDGELVIGARMPSEKTLQERFKVSRVTVQKALDELRQAGWVEKRAKRGLLVAGGFKGQRAATIPGILQIFYDSTIHPSQQTIPDDFWRPFAERAGGVWLTPLPAGGRFVDWARRFKEPLASRVVFWSGYEPSAEDERCLREMGAHAVVIGRRGADCGIPQVTGNHMEGGALITRHLAQLGHRRIGLLGGPPGHIVLEQITEGYRRVLAAGNIPFDPALLRADTLCDAAAGERGAEAMLAIPDIPTALIVMGDWRACGAMRALRRRGVEAPGDMAVAVYLHSAWLDDACHIPMTGVDESHEALVDGVLSAFAAQEAGQTPPDETVVPNLTLTVRRSCGAISWDR